MYFFILSFYSILSSGRYASKKIYTKYKKLPLFLIVRENRKPGVNHTDRVQVGILEVDT